MFALAVKQSQRSDKVKVFLSVLRQLLKSTYSDLVIFFITAGTQLILHIDVCFQVLDKQYCVKKTFWFFAAPEEEAFAK